MRPFLLPLLFSAMVGSAEVVPPPADPVTAFNLEMSQEANAEGAELRKNDAEKPRQPSLQSRVTLTDGSIVNGALHHHFVPAVSDTLGSFRLDLRAVESIARLPYGAGPSTSESESSCVVPCAFCVSFRNGDRLTVRLAPEGDRFVLDTLLGPLPVPLASISSLEIANNPAEALLYHCTFDSEASIVHPAVGPSGRFLGGEFVPGKVGKALRVRKEISSAIVPFEKGVIQSRGTIEFWAKVENDREIFGDGGDPRFFMLETSSGSETVFQLAANDGCGRGGLSIYHQGISVASENHCLWPARYESVLPGAIKGWHHYALVWNADGLHGTDNVVAAFIDGRRMPLYGDTGLAKAAHMAARFRDNPATLFFSLNPALNRGFNNKTDFLIDEFRIWSVAKTSFDLR